MAGILSKLANGGTAIAVIIWDNVLFLMNLVSPSLKKGSIVPSGCPGHARKWPAYIPPSETDSRSACPMLNALANHGILPHDGRNIPFSDVTAAIRSTFNFAPSFCFFAPKFAADFMERSYWKGKMDLSDLNLHADNAIEHDASLTRQDVALVEDQGKPDLELVGELLRDATGKGKDGETILTPTDLSRALSRRRADARRTNKSYSETLFHNLFGSANSSTMLTIFGGNVDDLTPMLTEERFSEDWEPRVLDRFGLTMAKFNALVLKVERGIDVKKFA